MKDSLRILHADTDDLGNPLCGGQPVRTFAINSRLAEANDITVFTSVYSGCQRRQNFGPLKYRRIGCQIPPFGLSPHLSFLALLGPHVRSTPHDIVVEEFTPPVGFCLLPWWTSKPVVSQVQWDYFESWEKRYHLPFSKWMRRIAGTGRYRYFVVQTESMRRKIAELLPNALIRIIPQGIDESAILPRPSGPPEKFALFLGRLDTVHKGLDLLLEAWTRACGPAEIPLLVAGEGPARPELESMIARDGLGHLVRLVGRVQGEAKSELLRDCRLVVMPSRYETFGIVAAEAMGAGKPVVAFDIENLNEVVSDRWGALVHPYDAEAFGRATLELWQRPEACREMGVLAQQEVRRFLWGDIARAQEDFYREVVTHHRA